MIHLIMSHGILRKASKAANQRFMKMLLYCGALSAIGLVGEQGMKLIRSFEPTNDWFEPYAIEVPSPQWRDNETPGEPENAKPYLFYGRRVRRAFDGTYSVTIVDTDEDRVVCDHSEKHRYTPKRAIPLVVLTIEEFLGEACRLDPGNYRIEATWWIERPGYWPATVTLASNEFQIIPNPRSAE